MISHYLRMAWRTVSRKKAYAITTITGLALGFTCCMLILLFVIDELSFDQYHVKRDRIYRLATEIEGSGLDGIAKVSGPWGPAAQQGIPEVENMTRFVMCGQLLVETKDQQFYESSGFYADSTVFEIFSYKFVAGNPSSALAGPNRIVITHSFAKKYFGDNNAINETLRIEGTDFQITGIIENVPSSSHFTFDFLLSMQSLQHPQRDSWVEWNQFYTYFLLRANAHPENVANKVKAILGENMEAENAARYNPMLQPLRDIHLYSHLHREISPNSDIMYVYIFSLIALLILGISTANFVNITTAQASVRAKEVGVRKVNGAARKQLFIQFMTEVLLICFTSLIGALVLTISTLPIVNDLTAKNIQPITLTEPVFVFTTLAVILLTASFAGVYPALYQSSLKPMQILKGKWTPSGNHGLRKSLVAGQFALSSTLVIASVIIFQQLQFIQSKPLGFDPQQIITIPIQSDYLRANAETIKEELLKHPGVLNVSLSGNIPGGSDWGIPTLPEGFTSENTPAIRVMAVDDEFLDTYGITIAQGRGFSKEHASDSATYLINEEAAKQLGWIEPLSKTFSMPVINRKAAAVVGVVNDFHFRSIREKIGPLLFFIPPREWHTIYSIKIDTRQSQETLAFIKEQWKRFDPEHPFTFSFFDDGYNRLYQQERRLAKIVGYFTAIGIFLACLGLYSLASYTTEQRTKEIGIRKAIGASSLQIVTMLSRQYIGLVLLGFGIALPISWYVLQRWLESFAYHVDFNVLLILLCVVALTVLALLTVGYRSLKAAKANPVDSLRNE